MRSLILISVYLSKDLFNRWLETPGAVLARVLIAVSLCLLFLFMSAGFSLTEQAMEKKIESFGVNTMIVRSIGPSPGQSRAGMSELLEPLGEQGTYFPFSMLYVNATLNSGKKGRIVLYDDASLPALAQLLGGLSSTVGTILPAIYALMEKHYTKATAATDREVAKRHAAAVNAALGAAAVYSEWAPLAPIMRSGLIEACGMLLVRLVFFARASFFSSSNTRTRTTPMMIIQ